VVYLYLDRLQAWLSGTRPRRPTAETEPAYLQQAAE
jgi:hypothetical protein